MSYEVGHYVDLSHLNRPKAAAKADPGRKSWQFPVGTHFDLTADLKAVLHIPVVFSP